MTMVQIQRDADGDRTLPVFHEIDQRLDAVRQLAFDLFAQRGGQAGHELDDWITAEREVMGWPAAELKEFDAAYEVDLTLPGFLADDVEVTATPHEVIVHAMASHERSGNDEKVIWSEFGSNEVYRHFDLPSAINADGITATLDNGMLKVMAPKSEPMPKSNGTEAPAGT